MKSIGDSYDDLTIRAKTESFMLSDRVKKTVAGNKTIRVIIRRTVPRLGVPFKVDSYYVKAEIM